ncbi:MAG: DUF2946 family protein [Lysobacter sp.]
MKNLFRPHRAFQYWVSRLALCAMLALVVMPTAGRLHAAFANVPATGATDVDGATHRAGGHQHNGAAAERRAPVQPDAPDQRHAGHEDCAYCPLLAQLAAAAPSIILLAEPPAGPAPSLTAAIGHALRRPHGLHARGPPTSA